MPRWASARYAAPWLGPPTSYYVPPSMTKVSTVKIRQDRVFTLGDKWETLLVGDLFGLIRHGGCFAPTSSDLPKQNPDS